MKEYMSLKILDKFRRMFERSGIDYDVMRKILQIKFTLDRRKQSFQSMQKKKKDKDYFKASLVGYGITGLFIAMIMNFNFPPIYRYGAGLGIIIVMLTTSMISDFSTVLLDMREKDLLGSKPINDKTINAAKFIHIGIYIAIITMVFGGPAVVMSFIKDGAAVAGVFILLLIVSDISVILFTGLFYFVFLKFFNGEKLKDIINYVQIALSIGIFVLYQVLVNVYDVVGTDIVFHFKWWQFILPSIVFASPIYIISGGEANIINIAFTIWTVLLPVIALILYRKVLVPHFEKNLHKMSNIEGTKKKEEAQKGKFRLDKFIAGLVCRSSQEKAVFVFTRNIIKRESKFKQSIYSSIGLGALFPFIFMISIVRNLGFAKVCDMFYQTGMHMSIYVGIMMVAPMITMVMYSEKFKGAWIYEILPFNDESIIRKGVFKSFMCKFCYPVFLFHTAVFTAVGGWRVIIDVIPAFFMLNIMSLVSYGVWKVGLPFTEGYTSNNAKNIGNSLLISFITLALCGGNYFIRMLNYGSLIYGGFLGILFIIMWKFSFKKKTRGEKNYEKKVNQN